ncbi:hypothetical protein ACFY3U_17940 [Micromonospora sp. NPDC000089]|uniref:hypothetical protein n=1 Tax=unclassified Micromonospora TaxID=2617518 RepID=UPI0036A1CCFC
MRLSRILMALTVGLAIVAAPTAAGAAQPQPSPDPTGSVTQPPPDYPPTLPLTTLTPSETTTTEDDTETLTGAGFGPNELVDIVVTVSPLAAAVPGQAPARRSDGSTVAMAAVSYPKPPMPTHSEPQPSPRRFTVRADANGHFVTPYVFDVVGVYLFTATGRTTGRTASATVTALPDRDRDDHGHLPVTGDNLGTPLKVGGGLVGAGAVLMLSAFAWRRRNRLGMTR